MLTEKTSSGVLTIRASSQGDKNRVAHRAIAAVRQGFRVVALIEVNDSAILAFSARPAGASFSSYGMQVAAILETPEAAVLAGLSGWAREWERNA